MTDDDANRPVPRDGSEPEPRARLRAVHPTELRWAVELGARPVVVGRLSVDGSLPLRHGTVSRRHLELCWDPRARRHVGHDLGSHNGSRVDGEPIGPTHVELHEGTVLQLGDVSLVYEVLPPDAPAWIPPLVPRASTPFDAGLEQSTRPRAPASVLGRSGPFPLPLHPPIPGDAPAIEALRRAVARVAPERTPVLLLGERGTGKQHVARELHRRSGRTGALVVVECAALGPGAAALPLASADGGTLFIDELGELPLPLQDALVQGLQARPPSEHGDAPRSDVRVIAASRDDLQARVDAGELRRELHACLAEHALRVPPLRERRGDLLTWIDRLHAAWLERRPSEEIDTLTLSPEAVELLLLHPWPDNLHELDRLVHELASASALPRPIPLSRLPAWLLGNGSSTPTMPVVGPPDGFTT